MSNTTIQWGSTYDEGRESQKRLDHVLRDIENNFELSGNPTLVDLGANMGFFTYGFADAGFQVTAIEPPNQKKFNHDRVTEYRHWVQSADDLPEGSFDFAVVFSVLHHIPKWYEVLSEVFEKTNFATYVEVPHPQEQHERWHGSREQYELMKHMESQGTAAPVVDSWEVSRRHKRTVWRVDTRDV